MEADRVVFENVHYRAEQSSACAVPGYLVLSAKAPATSLSSLGQSAAESLGPTLVRLTSAIEAVTGAKTVYCARFGEEWPQVHFHSPGTLLTRSVALRVP